MSTQEQISIAVQLGAGDREMVGPREGLGQIRTTEGERLNLGLPDTDCDVDIKYSHSVQFSEK